MRILANWYDMQACARVCDEEAACKIASYHDENVAAPFTNTCILWRGLGPRHPEQRNIYSWIKP